MSPEAAIWPSKPSMTLVDEILPGHLRRCLKLAQFERAKHISSHDELTSRTVLEAKDGSYLFRPLSTFSCH